MALGHPTMRCSVSPSLIDQRVSVQVLWKVMRLKCAGGTFNLNGKNDELNPLFPFIPNTSVLLPNVGLALQMTESEGKKTP